MCSSSTAAAAATSRSSASPSAQRNTSIGRSRLPPAASVPPAWRGQLGAVALGHLGEPRLGALEQAARAPAPPAASTAPSCACGASSHRTPCPAWMAMIPPAVSTQRTSSRPAAASARGQLLRARGSGAPSWQVAVGVGVAGHAGRAAARRRSNQSRKNHDSGGCCGVVISRTTTRPPGRVTRAISAQPAVEVGEVARAEAHRGGVELAVGVGQLERVALHRSSIAGRLVARQLEHPLGEVEPDDLARPRARQLDRQVAGAGGHVERARSRARPRARSAARSRQRWCMPAVMTEFMRS